MAKTNTAGTGTEKRKRGRPRKPKAEAQETPEKPEANAADDDDTVTQFEPIFGKQPGGAQEGQQSDHPTAGAMDAAPESGTPEPPAPPAPEKETEPDPEVDPILTYAEAARRIGKTRETVRRWAKDGLLKTVKHPSGVSGIRQSHFDKLYGTAQALHKGEN